MSEKKRNKKYRSRDTSNNKFLSGMPLSDTVVASSMAVCNNALLRLSLAEKKGGDLMLLVVYFGIAWYLAHKMANKEELQAHFADAIRVLQNEAMNAGPISDEGYAKTYDALQTWEVILKSVTRKEMLEAHQALQKEGGVPPMDDFIKALGCERPTFDVH